MQIIFAKKFDYIDMQANILLKSEEKKSKVNIFTVGE